MKSNNEDVVFPRTRSFLRLWSELAQGTFPFMREEVGELDETDKLFVTVCESVVKPEALDYAQWKGIGRPTTNRTAVFKAFLFKALHDIPTTKGLVKRLRDDAKARRLCGWGSFGDVPSEGQFSIVNKEFVERGFAEACSRAKRVKYVLRQGGNVKNPFLKRSLSINADSADVFGRASGVQGNEFP